MPFRSTPEANPFDALGRVVVTAEQCLEVLIAASDDARWLAANEAAAIQCKRRAQEKEQTERKRREESAAAAKAQGKQYGASGAPPGPRGQRLMWSPLGPIPETAPLHYQWSRRLERVGGLIQKFNDLLPTFEQAARACAATRGGNFLPLIRYKANQTDEHLQALADFIEAIKATAENAITRLSGTGNPVLAVRGADTIRVTRECLVWLDELAAFEEEWNRMEWNRDPVPLPDRIPLLPDRSETTPEFQAWFREELNKFNRRKFELRGRVQETREKIRGVSDKLMDVASLPEVDVDDASMRRLLDSWKLPVTPPELISGTKDFLDRLERRLRLSSAAAPPSTAPILAASNDADRAGQQVEDVPADKRLPPAKQADAIGISSEEEQVKRAKLAMKVRDEARAAGLRLRSIIVRGKGEHVHSDDWKIIADWWKGRSAGKSSDGDPSTEAIQHGRAEAQARRNWSMWHCSKCSGDFAKDPAIHKCTGCGSAQITPKTGKEMT